MLLKGLKNLCSSVHGFFTNDSLSSTPKNPDGSSAEEGSFDRKQGGFTLGGPFVPDKLFYFVAADVQRSNRTKQINPNRMDPELVSFLGSIGLPDENGPIERTDDAEVALAKLDWQASSNNLFTLRTVIDEYTFDKKAAPQTLEDLVREGYLRAVPVDPITGSDRTWELIIEDSITSVDQTRPGIFNVRSGSSLKSLEGTAYSEW